MCQLIDRDGEDDQDAGDEVLVDHRNADQRQAVAKDADDHGTDQRPDDASAASEEARPAEHDCGDAVQVLGGLSCVRIADLRSSYEQHGRET